jgi:AcrR family transcriptional regulator
MPRTRDDDAVLAASEACIAAFIAAGSTRIPVIDLAAAARIPERTFYRWFPTKADALRPVFAWGTREFGRVIRESPSDLATALDEAFDAILWGGLEARTRGLFPLVFADPASWSVFLHAVQAGDRLIAPIFAERLGVDPETETGGSEARAAAAAASSAVRLALEHLVATGEDPRPEYSRVIAAFRHGPLREPTARATHAAPTTS